VGRFHQIHQFYLSTDSHRTTQNSIIGSIPSDPSIPSFLSVPRTTQNNTEPIFQQSHTSISSTNLIAFRVLRALRALWIKLGNGLEWIGMDWNGLGLLLVFCVLCVFCGKRNCIGIDRSFLHRHLISDQVGFLTKCGISKGISRESSTKPAYFPSLVHGAW
jgi:hypothetical protein